MDKLNFSVEDFVLDTAFREWILSPTAKRNLQWEEYIVRNPQSIEHIRIARQIVLNMPSKEFMLNERQVDSLWEKIDKNLDFKDLPREAKSFPINSSATISRYTTEKSKYRINFQVLKVAALILLAFALGILYFTMPEIEKKPEIKWLTYSTKPGVKSSVTLSDGSVVKLNAGSSIRYVQNFVGNTREVFLDGEAFFEVAHDTIKPFIVHTKDISTRAMGTAFNIQAGQNGKIIISLLTGKVEVKSQQVPEFLDYLTPGEQIQTVTMGKYWEKGSFEEDVVMAWLDQTIIFDSTPLPEAVEMLENWFGVKITLLNFNDQNLTLSGKYKGETLKNILDGLSYTARFKYEIDGKQIKINFKQ
ncbi:ferric-dicitrate binding protein FerR, regulates iron transport through sigma-19 [Algoriphagus locisalis]|uniref:Ferric-dicitrate binding protein FerR, regulates iron transport through sigma-19 n=1 Tax=Algoriphagus locisalis TaxID=305507 RepID=A0A1I6YPI9_9BACT|nr:FecR family protein [Algoriphagus locisalis]SFT52360.1 ferric-dicitrate binding protein FerR, regulates iron transport through sigma-19 [Algoriphagus locisalis]